MKNKLKLLLAFSFIFTACAPVPPKSASIIRIKGSDTMYRLVEYLAQEYMTQHPEVSIYVKGGGTAGGFKALMNQEADICTASRTIKSDELSQIAQKYSSVGINTIIAKDAVSVYVNEYNSIKNLSLKQLMQIFTGEILNWKEVGGADDSILVIIRPPNSGTYLYFKEHILENREYKDHSKTAPTNQAVIQMVKSNRNAIGYGGITAGPEDMKVSVNGIRSSIENVRYDLYPISRYLYLYTLKKPKGEIRKFIDWIVSKEGQANVEKHGFISLWPSD